MYRFLVVDPDFHAVTLCRHFALDTAQVSTEIVRRCRAFERKIEVFGVARYRIEKAQRRAAVKGQRDHGAGVLQHAENPGLQIFAREVHACRGRWCCADKLHQIVFHSGWYAPASFSTNFCTCFSARRSLGESAYACARARFRLSRCCRRNSRRYSGVSPPGCK